MGVRRERLSGTAPASPKLLSAPSLIDVPVANMIPVRASSVSEAKERVTQIDAQRGKIAEQKDSTARVTQGFDQADRRRSGRFE